MRRLWQQLRQKQQAFPLVELPATEKSSPSLLHRTALILACESGSMESAELLLQNGANVGLMDKIGRDALYYATQTKSRALKRLLRSALKKWKKRGKGQVTCVQVGGGGCSQTNALS